MTTGFQQWRAQFVDQHHGLEPSAADAWNATHPPQDERWQEANANPWRDLFWSVARALNCLPSTFVDGNAHVYKQAEKYAALASARPVALSTLTDERSVFEAQFPQLDIRPSLMDGHYANLMADFMWMAWKKRASLAESAPTQQVGKSYTTWPAESLAGIAMRELKDESRWTEIRDLNAIEHPDMGSSDYYPVGTVLRMPATLPQPVAAEVADLRQALHDAATSLETVSRLGGRDEHMKCMLQVRGYALDRAKVAFAALSGTGSDENAKENGNGL